jgi:hypothetical protein
MSSIVLFDFNPKSNLDNWQVVNDVVMGGESFSKMLLNSDGNGVFTGTVSLNNNGGFCSVQHALKPITVKENSAFVLRIKGDGKKYQFRAKAKRGDYYSYIFEIQTTKDWQIIEIPFNEMYASFRGRKVALPNYDGTSLEEIAVLIGNKKAESFELLLDKIQVK